jgi:hypothetical protein
MRLLRNENKRGVLEYWSAGILGFRKASFHYSIIPLLHHSTTPVGFLAQEQSRRYAESDTNNNVACRGDHPEHF